jgi:hypothetical protein
MEGCPGGLRANQMLHGFVTLIGNTRIKIGRGHKQLT